MPPTPFHSSVLPDVLCEPPVLVDNEDGDIWAHPDVRSQVFKSSGCSGQFTLSMLLSSIHWLTIRVLWQGAPSSWYQCPLRSQANELMVWHSLEEYRCNLDHSTSLTPSVFQCPCKTTAREDSTMMRASLADKKLMVLWLWASWEASWNKPLGNHRWCLQEVSL